MVTVFIAFEKEKSTYLLFAELYQLPFAPGFDATVLPVYETSGVLLINSKTYRIVGVH